MNEFETIQVAPNYVWCVLPEEADNQGTSTVPKHNLVLAPSVLDVARRMNWKVGKKEVRQIGQGEMPLPGQPIEMNGWLVMRATEYSGIVSQEALDRVQVLLDEGVKIKGLLIADDLRHQEPSLIQTAANTVKERVQSIDWQKVKNDISESPKLITTAISVTATSIAGGVKERADKVDWDKVKNSLVTGLKAIALIMAGFAILAVAALILPVLAIAAVLIALLTIDPWLIVVDEEDRFFVIAEWWD